MEKIIVKGKGLLYTELPSVFLLSLAFVKDSTRYSKDLVFLRDKYGLAMGPSKRELKRRKRPNKKAVDSTIGVYIVNYDAYLKDHNQKVKRK